MKEASAFSPSRKRTIEKRKEREIAGVADRRRTMALQEFKAIWSFRFLFYTAVLLLVAIGVGELLAQAFIGKEATIFGIGDGDGEEDEGQEHPDDEHLEIKMFHLPTYWVWYTCKDAYAAIEANADALVRLIVSAIYHACFVTPAAALFHAVLLMTTFVVHTETGSNRVYLLWLVLVAAIADLTEDIALLVLLLGFPSVQYVRLCQTLAWCGPVKYGLWCVVYVCAVCGVLGRFFIFRKNRR